MNTNKIASIIIITSLIISIGIIIARDPQIKSNSNDNTILPVSNVEIKDGIQYITVNAKGGYFPRLSNGKAGIPTKLIIKTQGTYDCSAYLVINSLGYKGMLPSNGEKIIDAGTPNSDTLLRGTCGMGMYSFGIEFK